jgi:outer membrane protein OmpU
MKRLLLASTTILAASAGVASAEVTLSGDARMGVISPFGDGDAGFTSRARVTFTLSGETDGGLSFGASFRADNAADVSVPFDEDGDGVIEPGESTTVGGAESGRAGSVYISGAFGKLSMGDLDGAAQQAVGNVDGVGLTGLSDLNEAFYLHNFINDLVDIDPTAAYEYSAGGFTGIISVSNPSAEVTGIDVDVLSLGLKYATGDYSFSLGYENSDAVNIDHVILGATANFGAVALKANYGRLSSGGADADQYHISATYTADALALTAYYSDEDDLLDGTAYGLGASYDLGGGAKVIGGYVKNDTLDDSAFDLGLSFAF